MKAVSSLIFIIFLVFSLSFCISCKKGVVTISKCRIPDSFILNTATPEELFIIPVSGNDIYTYSIDSSSFSVKIHYTGLLGGYHVLSIKDSNGCIEADSFYIVKYDEASYVGTYFGRIYFVDSTELRTLIGTSDSMSYNDTITIRSGNPKDGILLASDNFLTPSSPLIFYMNLDQIKSGPIGDIAFNFGTFKNFNIAPYFSNFVAARNFTELAVHLAATGIFNVNGTDVQVQILIVGRYVKQ